MSMAVLLLRRVLLGRGFAALCFAGVMASLGESVRAEAPTSFSPIFVRDASGNFKTVTWTYTVNGGQPISVTQEADGESFDVTCKCGDLSLTVNPTAKTRVATYAAALSGDVRGSATIKATETLDNSEDGVYVKDQKLAFSVSAAAYGYSMSVILNLLTSFTPSAQWFLDRPDLDQLGVGYVFDDLVNGAMTGTLKLTIPGYCSKTVDIDETGESSDQWTITDVLDHYDVRGHTYTNVVVVERATRLPNMDLEGSFTDTTITYWVAQGVGMVKGIGQYSVMGEPLLVELKNATLLSAQTMTFPIPAAKEIGDVFDPKAVASSGLPVSYASSDETVAVVRGDGLIEAVGAGTACITASQTGNNSWLAANSIARVLVVKSKVSALCVPEEGGKVIGTGLFLLGQKVTLTATPNKNYTFLHWEDDSRSPIRSFVAPTQNVDVVATFGLTSVLVPPVASTPGNQDAMVGVPFSLALPIQSACLPTVSISGVVPPGLKFDCRTLVLSGVPTKAGVYWLKFKATNSAGQSDEPLFAITVSALPDWAVGSFNGAVDSTGMGQGSAAMSITALGVISGKISWAGTNYTFRAPSFSLLDGDGALRVVCTAVVGKASIPLPLCLRRVDTPAGVSPALLGEASSGLDGMGTALFYRSVWKDSDMAVAATNYVGYYTAALPGDGAAGSGYLAFTVDRAGGIKTAGKLADGTTVSLTGSLYVNGNGAVVAVLYTAPAAYKGGWFCGTVEFVDAGDAPIYVRLQGDEPIRWASLDPKATKECGAGFDRLVAVVGGYYSSGVDLRALYESGLAVSVGSDALPPLLAAVKHIETSDGYTATWNEDAYCDASSLSPDGLTLTVGPATGIGTSLLAPASDAVLRGEEAGVYDYGTDANGDGQVNTSGLSLAFTRASGIFKGAYNICYDYVSQVRTTDSGETQTWSHTIKRAAFEGVLTPVREDSGDGCEGRGFSLLSERAMFDTGNVDAWGEPIITYYTVNGSYDFLLLRP